VKPGSLTPILLLACFGACTSTSTSVRYLAPDLGPVDTVALLPPTLIWSTGDEPRSYVEHALFRELVATHDALVVLPVHTSRARLAAADLAEAYEQLPVRRSSTGVLDSATVVELCTGLGVQRLLFAKVVHYEDINPDEPDTPCSVRLEAELWDGRTGRIGWHAVTTAETFPQDLGSGVTLFSCQEGGIDLVDAAVRDFAKTFLTPHRGKGRDPNRGR
jgi:hypothetical protein